MANFSGVYIFLLFIMYTIHLSRFNSPLNVSTDAEIPNITLAIVYILLGVIVGFPWGISTFLTFHLLQDWFISFW